MNRRSDKKTVRGAWGRAAACLLLLAVLAGLLPQGLTVAFAAETVCVHRHDAACGYAPGTPCAGLVAAHVAGCAPDCAEEHGHVPGCPAECADAAHISCDAAAGVHNAFCGYTPAAPCTHVCSVESGCIQPAPAPASPAAEQATIPAPSQAAAPNAAPGGPYRAGVPFSVGFSTGGAALRLALPQGLTLAEGAAQPEDGVLALQGETLLTFTAEAGAYSLQLTHQNGTPAGQPVAFTVLGAAPAEGEEGPPENTEDGKAAPAEGEDAAPAQDEPLPETLLEKEMEDGTRITVEGALPADTEMQAVRVEPTPKMDAALDEMAAEEERTVEGYAAYDITLTRKLEDGTVVEVQPAEGHSVRVTIHNPELAEQEGTLGVAYVADDQSAAEVVAEGSETAEVAHFSIYAVVKVKEDKLNRPRTYTVTFLVPDAYGTPKNAIGEQEEVEEGGLCRKPADPNIPGLDFVEWRKIGELTSFDFNAPITGDLTLMGYFKSAKTAASEDALRNIVESAPKDGSLTAVELAGEIALRDTPLEIPSGAKILLSGAYRLIGAGGQDTLTVNGELTIDGITVTHNSGESGRGVTVAGGSLTLLSGAVSYNTTAQDGAGVYVGGGTFTMQGGDISHNTTTAGSGGGVYIAGGAFTMPNPGLGFLETPNGSAGAGKIDFNTAAVNGGGIYYASSKALTWEAGTASGNTAGENGGGLYLTGAQAVTFGGSSSSPKFKNNTATSGNGGGMWADVSGPVSVSTRYGPGFQDNTAGQNGGGLYLAGATGLQSKNWFAFWGNTAKSGSGGGMWAKVSGSVVLHTTAVLNNTAGQNGGGVYLAGASEVELSKWGLHGNTAQNGNGGGMYLATDAAETPVCIRDSYSSVESGSGIDGNKAPNGDGGAFYFQSGAVNLSFSYVDRNTAKNGGGVYMGGTASLTTTDAGFYGNVATVGGGAIGLPHEKLRDLTVGEYCPGGGGVRPWDLFKNNTASKRATAPLPADVAAIYTANIPDTTWSIEDGPPNGKGYNNYDIQYIDCYTVTFVDHDGTVLKTERVERGGDATAPANPARAGHTFTGWDKAFTNVQSDLIVTAQYTPNPAETFTVTFAPGAHGAFAQQSTAGLAAGAATPAAPTVTGQAGWRFTGWSPAVSATVTASVTYTAQWAEAEAPAELFTVIFVDWNGATLKTQQVARGGAATAPASPSRAGYAFTGWDRAFTNVQSNLVVTARYAPAATYSVTFAPGAHGTFAPRTVAGLAAGAATPAAPAVTGQAGWRFTGWSPAVAPTVTASVTYTAQWAETNTEDEAFTVTFVDWDGAVLKTETVARGGDATAPPRPTREDCTFTGWDTAFTNVQSDLTVTALYVVNTDRSVTVDDSSVLRQALHDEGVGSIVLFGTEIPLWAGRYTRYVWALLNLILALAGLVLGVVTLLRAVARKGRRDSGEEEAASYETEEEAQKRKKTRLVWFIVSVLAAVAGAVLFLLTEDITRPMVLADNWTVVNAVILLVEIIGMVLAFTRKKAPQAQEEA